MKNMWSTLISLLIICLVFSLMAFLSVIFPFRIKSHINPSHYGLAYENIAFKTKDNIIIKGWFIPNQNPRAKTIILLHGYPADKGNILPGTYFLYQYFHLLYFDFRRLGESGGSYSTIGILEQSDLLAAIQYLQSRGLNEIGVWGFSLGGAVALMTAPNAPQIKAIVAESSYARLSWVASDYYLIPLVKYFLGELTRLWGILFLQHDIQQVAPADALKKISVPVLLIHAIHDPVIPYKHALALQTAMPKNAHNQFLVTEMNFHGGHDKNQDVVIERFFLKHLTKQTSAN